MMSQLRAKKNIESKDELLETLMLGGRAFNIFISSYTPVPYSSKINSTTKILLHFIIIKENSYYYLFSSLSFVSPYSFVYLLLSLSCHFLLHHSLPNSLSLPPSLTPTQSLPHYITPCLTPSLTLSLSHSLYHSFHHSLLHSITPSLPPSLHHSLLPSLPHSITPSLTPSSLFPQTFNLRSLHHYLNLGISFCVWSNI